MSRAPCPTPPSRRWLLAAVLLLGACVMPTAQSKDILANPGKYLDENFRPEALSENVRAALVGSRPTQVPFRNVVLTATVNEDKSGQVTTRTCVETLTNVGDGLLQRRTEWANNGIVYRTNLALTYRNLVAARWQAVFSGRTQSARAYEISGFTVAPEGITRPLPGAELVYEYTFSEIGVYPALPSKTSRRACKATEVVPARTFHSTLSGDAIVLACEMAYDGILQERSRSALLTDLGIVIPIDSADSNVKLTHTLTAVAVEAGAAAPPSPTVAARDPG